MIAKLAGQRGPWIVGTLDGQPSLVLELPSRFQVQTSHARGGFVITPMNNADGTITLTLSSPVTPCPPPPPSSSSPRSTSRTPPPSASTSPTPRRRWSGGGGASRSSPPPAATTTPQSSTRHARPSMGSRSCGSLSRASARNRCPFAPLAAVRFHAPNHLARRLHARHLRPARQIRRDPRLHLAPDVHRRGPQHPHCSPRARPHQVLGHGHQSGPAHLAGQNRRRTPSPPSS